MCALVFFGAGASKPFGIPTMQEMVTEFENNLKDDDTECFNFYSEIKNSLIKEYGRSKVDIEVMFSVIQGIASNIEPKELGHYAYYYISKNCSSSHFSNKDIEKSKRIQQKLQEYLKDTCQLKIPSDKSTEIYNYSYVSLFTHIEGREEKTYNDGKYRFVADWNAYTTNYDNVFEGFWESIDKPLDHFDPQENSNNYIFNMNKTLSKHSFCKLHGSLDWTYEIKTKNVMRKKISSFNIYETAGDVMLFPIQQKDLYLHPWFTLFHDFKRGLLENNKWYFIGYAFNDEFIFNVVKEVLNGIDKSLVIINPDARQIRNKFPVKLREKIIGLPIKFGDRDFGLQFKDAKTNRKTLTFKIKTQSDFISIRSSHEIQNSTHKNEKTNIKAEATYVTNKQYDISLKNPDNEEFLLELEFEYLPPFEDELTIIMGSKKEVKYSVYYGEKYLRVNSNTSKFDPKEKLYFTEPLKMYSSSLF